MICIEQELRGEWPLHTMLQIVTVKTASDPRIELNNSFIFEFCLAAESHLAALKWSVLRYIIDIKAQDKKNRGGFIDGNIISMLFTDQQKYFWIHFKSTRLIVNIYLGNCIVVDLLHIVRQMMKKKHYVFETL